LIPDDLGGGFKMRVLTLSALRVPILGLRAAMVGTTFIPGVHYHEVETLEEMADALPALVDDLPKLNAMQEAAYAHCRTCFNWSARGQLLASFAQGLKTKPSPFNG